MKAICKVIIFEAGCPHKCSIYTTEVESGTWKWVKNKEVVHSSNRCWNRTIYDRLDMLTCSRYTSRLRWDMLTNSCHFGSTTAQNSKPFKTHQPHHNSYFDTTLPSLLPSLLLHCVFSIYPHGYSVPTHTTDIYIYCQRTKTTRENPFETRCLACLASDTWHGFSIQDPQTHINRPGRARKRSADSFCTAQQLLPILTELDCCPWKLKLQTWKP